MPHAADAFRRLPDVEDRAKALARLRHEVSRRTRLAERWWSQTKRCPSCAADRTFADFGANAARRDGLQAQCRDCKNGRGRMG